MTFRLRLLAVPALIAALAATGAAQAGDAPAGTAPDGVLAALISAAHNAPAPLYEGAAKSYRGGIMTPQTLKGCLVLAYRIDQTGAAVRQMKADLRDLDGKIAETGPRLKAQAVAGLTDPDKRQTYTDGVAQYNRMVEQRREQVAAHNRRVREYSEMAGRFNVDCNGRTYFPSDLAAVTPDLPPEVRARLK